MKNRHVNIPVFVPHMGCPNDCSFCNQRKITGQVNKTSADEVREIIENHLKTIDKPNTEVEVAFFGGSFTGIPKEDQMLLLGVAHEYFKKGLIDGIRLSTRPDYIDTNVLDLLKSYNVTAIELGAQSMVDEVLAANDRGHTSLDTERAAKLIKEYGFELGLQMMTGLYLDDYNGAIYTAKKIIEQKPDCVRIYPTLTIKDTKLHKLYDEGKYVPMQLDETVSLCARLLELFEDANIKVLRVGLLGTENINKQSDVVAGPFHQSIGELAESEKFYNKVIKEIDLLSKRDINICVNPRYISIAVGNLKRNRTRFENIAEKNVKIVQDEDVPYGTFIIR